jgi:hypothetical protein
MRSGRQLAERILVSGGELLHPVQNQMKTASTLLFILMVSILIALPSEKATLSQVGDLGRSKSL